MNRTSNAHKSLLFLSLSLALAAGCGGDKKDAASSCPAMSITVDGEPLVMAKTLGIADKQGGLMVSAYNHDKITCEGMLATMRATEKDEIDVRAYATIKSPGMMDSVSVESYSKAGLGESLKIVSNPKKAGDTAAICVSKVELKPEAGMMKGKTVVVEGLFTGEHCGMRK